MKIAVIDCGSNTFNLLIAEASQSGWVPVFQTKLPVKLGAGGYQSKEIVTDRFTRGIDAFVTHAANIRNFGCDRTFAFATSALRDASNGQLFIDKAFELTGIQIQTIDGDKEAELIYKGIQQTIDTSDQTVLVMDIGGGSTEFIIANKTGILWKQSFKLGVSRLYDKIKPSDPVEASQLKYLRQMLGEELGPLRDALHQYPATWLIGSSGSFDTLMELYYHSQNISTSEIKQSNEILISAFPHIYEWIMKSTYHQRLVHPVIPAIRAEYMPLAMVLMDVVFKMHPFKKLFHSAFSLKEGAMKQLVDATEWPAEIDSQNESPEDYLEA